MNDTDSVYIADEAEALKNLVEPGILAFDANLKTLDDVLSWERRLLAVHAVLIGHLLSARPSAGSDDHTRMSCLGAALGTFTASRDRITVFSAELVKTLLKGGDFEDIEKCESYADDTTEVETVPTAKHNLKKECLTTAVFTPSSRTLVSRAIVASHRMRIYVHVIEFLSDLRIHSGAIKLKKINNTSK